MTFFWVVLMIWFLNGKNTQDKIFRIIIDGIFWFANFWIYSIFLTTVFHPYPLQTQLRRHQWPQDGIVSEHESCILSVWSLGSTGPTLCPQLHNCVCAVHVLCSSRTFGHCCSCPQQGRVQKEEFPSIKIFLISVRSVFKSMTAVRLIPFQVYLKKNKRINASWGKKSASYITDERLNSLLPKSSQRSMRKEQNTQRKEFWQLSQAWKDAQSL